MVTNTLTSTDDDLGDTVATYVFDIRLARSLLLVSGLAFVGCLVAGAAMTSMRGEGGIASVDHAGPDGGSRTARWNGTDYVCRVERRDGTSVTFDNYIIDAPSLGRAIEHRSLL